MFTVDPKRVKPLDHDSIASGSQANVWLLALPPPAAFTQMVLQRAGFSIRRLPRDRSQFLHGRPSTQNLRYHFRNQVYCSSLATLSQARLLLCWRSTRTRIDITGRIVGRQETSQKRASRRSGRERQSAAPHFSQADFWTGIHPVCRDLGAILRTDAEIPALHTR